jgi:hypothetical protein
MRRFALAAVLVGAIAGTAAANGRAPGTSTIHFQQGHETNIAAGMTFGLVLSHDGGTTWQWMCEDAIGYGGVWDPDYSYTTTGALFATTFNGLKVSRNGCTFDSTPPGNLFVSADELAPNGDLTFASVDPTDDKVYKSTNDGMTFPTSATPPGAMLNDWYSSLVYQQGSSTNIWLSGYRFVNNAKQLMVYKSTNGGTSFSAVALTGIASTDFSNSSALTIAGIDGLGNVYAVISYPNGSVGGTVWKLTGGVGTWVKIETKADNVSLLVRSNGDLVLGTPTLGSEKSVNGGTSWTPLTNPPHINCLVENSAHEVWACTRNYGDANNPFDGFGIMKTTDLNTWTGVLKYEDIQAPVSCAAGTMQKDVCEAQRWCGLKQQLGITSTAIDCSGFVPDGATDAGGSGSGGSNGSGSGSGGGGDKDKGCCETGSGGAAPMLMSLLVAGALLRRRRTKEM